MFRVQVPYIFRPSPDLKNQLDTDLVLVAQAAFREVAIAAKGFEIAYLQFQFKSYTIALNSFVRKDGMIEIEAVSGLPNLPFSTVTAKQLKDAQAKANAKGRRN